MGMNTARFNKCIDLLRERAGIQEVIDEDYEKYSRIGAMAGKSLDEVPMKIIEASNPGEYFMSRFDGRESLLGYIWKCMKRPIYSLHLRLLRGDFDDTL